MHYHYLNLEILAKLQTLTQHLMCQCNYHKCPQQLKGFWAPSQAQLSTMVSLVHSKKTLVELVQEKKNGSLNSCAICDKHLQVKT